MQVLDYWREKEPKFAEVDDATLTQFIGDTYPEFLAQPDFKQAYETPIKRARAEDAVGVGVARQNYPELYSDSSMTLRPVFGKPAPLSPPAVVPKPAPPAVDADKMGTIAAMSGGDLSRLSPELRVSLKAMNYTPPPGFPKAELGADEVNSIYDRLQAETEQLTAEGHETLNRLKPIPGLKFQPDWSADELKALATAPKWLRRTAGYMDTAGAFLDFFNSAEGAITLPLLAAPGAAGVASRVAVGAQMTEGAFHAVDALGEELAKPERERDEKLVGMLESQIVASVAMVGTMGGHEAGRLRLKYEALAAKHPLPKLPSIATTEYHPLDWTAGKVADVMGGIKDVFGPPPITAKPGVPYERGQKPAGYRAPFDAPPEPVEAPRPAEQRLTPVVGRAAGPDEQRVTDESLQADALQSLAALRAELEGRTVKPEPRPSEMEYAGGEMPGDNSKFPIQNVKSSEVQGTGTMPGQAKSATTPPVVETAPVSPELEIPTGTAIDPSIVQTVEFPIAKLRLSKDVPNFKGGASESTGTVAGQELKGKYERRGTAPIVAWERLDGTVEVITGRHRFDLAKRTGEKTIPTQIVREADGFTKDQALTFDAEANIRDGQGEVTDYATYFKGTNISVDEAQSRGLLSRAKGKAGWSLAKDASNDVYALWQADKLTDAQAVAIANAAPGDAGAQAIGSKFALAGKSADFISNVIKASRAEAGTRAQSLDLFGADDSAMKAMEEQASRASGFQREIAEQIRAVQGAAKRPDVARKLGVDVKDPEAINAKVTQLKEDLARWENWPMQPDLVALVRGEHAPVVAPKLRAGEKGTGDLLQGEDAPFNLAGESAKDGAAIAAAKAQAEATARAAAEFEAKNQGTMFSPPALGGGDLGKTPPRAPSPVDDPRHSVFDAVPMEMPEAVRMVKALTGLYPKIREKLGRAAGLFRFTQGEGGKGRVELKASIFDLLDANDKARIRQEAVDYAKATGGTAREQANIAREREAFLLDEAYEAAKSENPKQAMKVIWHEIGHVVDWLPDHIIRGRGNFFGRIASLKGYLKHVLPLDPKRIGPFQQKPTPAETVKIRKEAYAAAQADIGPMREIIETILVEEPIYREAGITPEMVKQLFGMDARETMPELYRWFAEQSREVKKEVVRAAMQGIVDARLKSVSGAGREQVGTKTVKREVRRREGRPPTPQEVASKFKELFRAELERRNVAELTTLKAELEPLIAWWRGTEKMPDYFKTSEEMYAEAFSVFANNPAALEARAPTYAKLLWNYLDRKPQVRALYDQIQADIKSGAIMPDRVKALWEMWDRNDARSLVIARDSLKTKGRDVLDNVQYHFDRRFGPIYRAARGTSFQGSIADAVGNFLYRMSEHERYLAGLNEGVGKTLVKHNLDWSHDLGEYLFHKRIETERYNIANPLGWTSKNSLERLAEMKATLGPERFSALEAAATEYRAQYEKFVVAELDAAQMFSPDLQKIIQERAHYATFSAVKGIPDVGIEKILETRFGASVTPHIFKQLGNAGEIKNPATATVLKGLSLISAAYRNSMKKEVVRMLQSVHPTDITPAKTRWNGKAREAVIVDNNPGVGTIVYLDKGETKAFYVRRVVSDAVNGSSGGDNLAYSLLLNATSYQKALFTQLNYGFWPVNFVRDSMGWMMQMPGALTPLHWAKNLPRALVAARQSVTHSKPNPWADAALKRKMLISKGDPRGVWAAAENEFEVKLASFGMDPVQWKGQHDAVHRVVKAWDFYKNLGQTFERVNKISGMLYLDEKFPTMPEWKKREIIRERSGSPNFLERGASNPAIDMVALFYNPWKEGVRGVMKSAKENPMSFTAKATVAVLMPTILQSAAVNGWLGDDRKEQYSSIPDFDLTNYLCVPLGWVDRKARKVAYLRLPLWEPARIAHGTLFQGLTDRGQGIAAHAGGQLPGLNPLWKVGLAWASYAQGKNPMDTQRGVTVMPPNVFEAGGPATAVEMAKYSWNEMGGSILWRFRNLNLESSPVSDGEKLLATPGINNALGRWIKVSDRGLADQQRSVQNELSGPKAEMRLGVDEILRRMTGEGSWDNLQRGVASGDDAAVQRAMSAAQLSPAERMLMREPYAQKYFATKFPELMMSKANVNAKLWFDAKSNEEREKLIQRGIIQPAK